MSSPMLAANPVNRRMPLPGDLPCPVEPGDTATVGTAFADVLRSTDASAADRHANRPDIARPVQRSFERGVHSEPPRRADPSPQTHHCSPPAESSPKTDVAVDEEPNTALAGQPESSPSTPSGTPVADGKDGPVAAEETPAREMAEAELPIQLPAGEPAPVLVPDPAARLKTNDLSVIAVDAAAAPAPPVKGDGHTISPPAAPEAAPPRIVAGVSQHADPVISIAAPVVELEILQGNPGAAPVASQVAVATGDASTNMPGAAAIAIQAQQAAASGDLLTTSRPSVDATAGADTESTMSVGAPGGTGGTGDEAGDAGHEAGGGNGDHFGAGPAGVPNAMAAGRAEPVRGEGTTGHSVATQLAVPVARAAKAGIQRVEIALEPAALGRVDVRLDFSADGRVSAFFVTDNRQALDALRADAQTLARALADAGVDTGSLNFGLRQGAQGNDGGRYQSTSGRASGEQPSVNPELSNVAAATRVHYSGSRGRLDIRA